MEIIEYNKNIGKEIEYVTMMYGYEMPPNSKVVLELVSFIKSKFINYGNGDLIKAFEEGVLDRYKIEIEIKPYGKYLTLQPVTIMLQHYYKNKKKVKSKEVPLIGNIGESGSNKFFTSLLKKGEFTPFHITFYSIVDKIQPFSAKDKKETYEKSLLDIRQNYIMRGSRVPYDIKQIAMYDAKERLFYKCDLDKIKKMLQ